MKFATATLPPKIKNKYEQLVAWFLGGIFLVLSLVQLVRFEKFITFIEGYISSDGAAMGQVIAAILVTLEVFALPFLLRMKLSPLMRIVSIVCGWLASLLLLSLALLLAYSTQVAVKIGMFVLIANFASSEWAVWFAAAVVTLTGMVSYLLCGDIKYPRAGK